MIHQLVIQDVPPDCWTETFRRLILTHWLDAVYREDDALRAFRGDEHEATIAQFREFDRRYISTLTRRIRRVLAGRQGRVSAAHGGEPGLLRHEAGKRKRHIPLRRLFERIPNLLPTLKPCLMMSPLSVAQFLPADRYRFDIVVFDEASQVRPHDAIGAIMRGKQLIVAGDSKQLPPTAFFDRTADDGTIDDEQDLRALESILDGLGTKGMPSAGLPWHYRSRHEDLIAYSNHHFYDRRLVTFPSPTAERSPARGVRLNYVPDARYEDVRDKVLGTPVRVNRVEAQCVARLVMHHARTRPDESLGVVALGTNQREEVEEAIKQARMLDQSLDDFFRPDKPDPFFVKALEQVQGDERDVIMISIGYGKNAQGMLSHNFGPINQDGGERRLNVLVTRARLQVIVVSSIRSADIDLARTNKLGPRLLKNYLDFAERGQIALEAETTGGDGEYESPFEEEVGEAIKRAGYIVHRQVGSSRFRIDLAIVDPRQPGRYLLGIECDGRTYHGSKTARDRDRLRQEILEGLGWKIHRVWSTDWIRRPERELDRVIARVEELLSRQEGDSDLEVPGATFSDEVQRVSPLQTGLGGVPETQIVDGQGDVSVLVGRESPKRLAVPYRIAALRLDDFGDILAAPISLIADVVVACVEVEAPIHRDLLSRRVVTAWGYQRAGARIAARMEQAISVAVQQGRIKQQGGFLWPSLKIDVVPRGAASDGAIRDISHVADEEILRGITLVLEHAFSLTQDELVVQTSRLFGYQRTGSDINRRLREMVQVALKT
nr:DUF3320 domain-containing protein [Chloroflexota bacterium]